jgi:acetyl-CoA carboxylase carboxyltransferase component
LDAADDRETRIEEIRARLDAVRSPFRTAERFAVEDVIDPRETRARLCDWIGDAYAVLPKLLGRPSFGMRP